VSRAALFALGEAVQMTMDTVDGGAEIAVRCDRRMAHLLECLEMLPRTFCRDQFLPECAVVIPEHVEVGGQPSQHTKSIVRIGH
jgi:hypothetical protein